MFALSLVVALAVTDARADEPLECPPKVLTPLKMHWYDVDGVPRKYGSIEGWLLEDPASRPHALKRARMRWLGATMITAGTTAAVLGLGFGFRDLNSPQGSGQSSTFYDWIPAIGGAVLLAVGIPIMIEGNHQEKKAIQVYTGVMPKPGGATVSVGATF